MKEVYYCKRCGKEGYEDFRCKGCGAPPEMISGYSSRKHFFESMMKDPECNKSWLKSAMIQSNIRGKYNTMINSLEMKKIH